MFKKYILFFLLVCGVFFGCEKKSDPEDLLEERLRRERLEAEKKAADLRTSKGKTTTKLAIVKLHGNLFTPEEQEILKERVKRNTQGRVYISFRGLFWPGQEEQPQP